MKMGLRHWTHSNEQDTFLFVTEIKINWIFTSFPAGYMTGTAFNQRDVLFCVTSIHDRILPPSESKLPDDKNQLTCKFVLNQIEIFKFLHLSLCAGVGWLFGWVHGLRKHSHIYP